MKMPKQIKIEMLQELETQESNAQESNAQESNVQESNAQESNAQESNAQESNAQESNTQESNVQESKTINFNRNRYVYIGIFLVLALGTFGYGISKIYGFVLFPDEFGYWVHGAKLLGMDWEEVAGIHPYYSFGIGFLMAPLMLLLKNPVVLYRAMVGLNFLLIIGSGMLLYRILGKLVKDFRKEIIVMVSGVSMAYSSFLVYAQTTLPEIFLVFLYLAIIVLYIDIVESDSLWKMLLLAVLLALLYVTHMRTVGIVLAGIVLLGMLTYQKKKKSKNKKISKNTLLMAGVFLLLFVGGTVIKSVYTNSVFANADSWQINVNDYGGQIEKIKKLFSFSGIVDLCISFIGKIFYLGSATFGLFYWGMAYVIGQWKSKKVSIYFFLVWSMLFTLGVTSLYTMGTERIDGLLYGRYNEMILPVFIALGMVGMLKAEPLWNGMIQIFCIQSICVLILNYAIEFKGIETTNRHSIIGVAYALTYSDNYIFNFTRNVYIGGCLTALIVTVLVYTIKKYKLNVCLLLVITLLQFLIGFHSCNSLNYAVNEKRKDDIALAMRVKAMCAPEQEVVYMYSKGYGYVDVLQFCLRDKSVKVRIQESEEIENLDPLAIVVTYPQDLFLEDLGDYYDSLLQSTHFNVYYNKEK